MSNTNTEIKRGRGRPSKQVILPDVNRMTINDIVANNPHIVCRLSIYKGVAKLVKSKVLRYTGDVERTVGGVGKPLDVLQTVESYRRSRASKKAARTVKLAKLAKLAPVTLAPPAPAVEVAPPVCAPPPVLYVPVPEAVTA